MEKKLMRIGGREVPVYRARTLVIGSGCAGFNAADWLHSLGERDLLLMTEGMTKGTSRNTGSDKQTYYKLSLASDEADSVRALAETLWVDGVHGDTALVEAACSAQSFYKLVQLGVPFPKNEYGEYVGYKTDHDPRRRATSAGPLTSRLMTECLEAQVRAKEAVRGAKETSRKIVLGACNYADDILTDLQRYNNDYTRIIESNREELHTKYAARQPLQSDEEILASLQQQVAVQQNEQE